MSAETTIYNTLSGNAPVTAICATRIYPDWLSQELILPAIVYVRANTEVVDTLLTASVAEKAVMEIWCNAEKRVSAEDLADKAATALNVGLLAVVDRRAEFDPESLIYSSVLLVEVWTL